MDGRVMTGRQALKLHLVDEMGNLPDAIDKAAELAGLPDSPPRILEPERQEGGILGYIFGSSSARALKGLIMRLEQISGAQREFLQLWRAF